MWTDHAPEDRDASALLAKVAADPFGQVTVAFYDTGRLVVLAPWLAGHEPRVDFLCRRQSPDGSWGGRDGYALVPTMSVTAALLTELTRKVPRGQRKRLARAALRGLAALQRLLVPGVTVPDTIGVDLIVPALLEELRGLLANAVGDPFLVDLPSDAASTLRLPAGLDPRSLPRARSRLATREPSQEDWRCLEIFGPAAVAAPSVRPAMGAVGCSPAATGAWLGGASGDRAALAFLHRLQKRHDGPVPGFIPITYLEGAQVLNALALAGFTAKVPEVVLDRLEAGLTAHGAPAAPGLLPDGDNTATVLAALVRHGRVHAPGALAGFWSDDHFRCFLDERKASVSTNARALEALELYRSRRPDHQGRFAATAASTARWLLDQQRPDGSWWDRWHASPYYATSACVLALARYDAAWARVAINKAAGWMYDTQQADGSWGRWQGTVEETSYAVQVLARAAHYRGASAAAARGCHFLADPPLLADHPPLWHAKDLFAPLAVIRAQRLASLRLGARLGRGSVTGA
jgi:halimadienyl-diphosphate synthase